VSVPFTFLREETMMRKTVQIASLLVAAALLGGVAMPTWAVDGVILIDQNKAMAGNITPGDTPGFPVTISLPGSYRLAGNLTVPDANTTAITITADNVSLDLNGFMIQGPTVCDAAAHTCAPTGTGDGIDFGNRFAITIVNGSIKGMGHDGLNGEVTIALQGRAARVERVSAISNGGAGMHTGIGEIIVGSIAFNNGSDGILCGAECIIKENVSGDNGGDGIRTGSTSNVSGNTINRNARYGLSGALDTGYANNIFSLNSLGNIQGGTSLGQNLCEDLATGIHLCP
jgi:hypothetical protein